MFRVLLTFFHLQLGIPEKAGCDSQGGFMG